VRGGRRTAPRARARARALCPPRAASPPRPRPPPRSTPYATLFVGFGFIALVLATHTVTRFLSL